MSDRKQQILDIAADLMQSKAFSAFSYQDIADRLGITKAAIHSHFRTKEILGQAFLESYLELTKAYQAEAEAAGDDVWDVLTAYLESMKSSTILEDKVCPVTVLQVEWNVIPESMRRGISRIYHQDRIWMTGLLQQGLDEGVMAFPGTAEDQADLIQATVQGAFMNARAEGLEMYDNILGQTLDAMRVDAPAAEKTSKLTP